MPGQWKKKPLETQDSEQSEPTKNHDPQSSENSHTSNRQMTKSKKQEFIKDDYQWSETWFPQ